MLQHDQYGTIYQVEDNHPHLLALSGYRSQPVSLNITMTSNSHTSDVVPLSSDPSVVINRGHRHADYHIFNDKIAPIYLTFVKLAGIHILKVDITFRTKDNDFFHRSHLMYVQPTNLGPLDPHWELVERFNYKVNNGIQQHVMFPSQAALPDHERIVIWGLLPTYTTFKGPWSKPFQANALYNNPEFVRLLYQLSPASNKRLAILYYLIELTNTDPDTIQKITVFLDRHETEVHLHNAYKLFEIYYGLKNACPPPPKDITFTGAIQEETPLHGQGMNDPCALSMVSLGNSRTVSSEYPGTPLINKEGYSCTVSNEYPGPKLTNVDDTNSPGSTAFQGFNFDPRPIVNDDSLSPPPTWSQVICEANNKKTQ